MKKFRAANDRMCEAKRTFTQAILGVLNNDTDAGTQAEIALAELNAARAELEHPRVENEVMR